MPPFDAIKDDINQIFENHPKLVVLLDKIDTAQDLFDYLENLQHNSNPYHQGYVLRCNFPAKTFLEKIWIEDLFNALIAELEELLSQKDLDENKQEDIIQVKTNLLNFKQWCADLIKETKEPTSTIKTLFPTLAINENTVIFYSQRDFNSIIHSLIYKFSEQVSDGLKFEIYLPPNQSEKVSDEENIRNYAEMVFDNAAKCGLAPEKITLFINGKKIEPTSMFKDHLEPWKKQSEEMHAERINKAIEEEKQYFKKHR